MRMSDQPNPEDDLSGGTLSVDVRGLSGNQESVPRQSWFRGDINGLRALAIIPVVAFHASIPGFSGGFIGVDIFYVISGYLITSQLLKQATARGTISLGDFWAKRFRRLAPALALVVLVTLAFSIPFISPLDWSNLGLQGGSAVLYVSNLLFAYKATNYFGDDVNQSPFLHTWSLGVEEQFYILWPILIITTCIVATNRKWPIRGTLIGIFSVTFAVSFAVSLYATEHYQAIAFYVLPTRAWEFAAAGMIAALPLERWLGNRILGNSMVVAGVAILLYGVVMLTAADPFPGTAALIPVVGTLLVIVGGTTCPKVPNGHWASRILSHPVLQWIGTVSYSWYLWHWPFIILTVAAFQNDAIWLKTTAAVASLGAGALTYYKFENPIRFNSRLSSSQKSTFIFTGVVSGAVAVIALIVFVAGTHLSDTTLRHYASVREAVPSEQCSAERQVSPGGIAYCAYGDIESQRTVILAGDSHGAQWRDALAVAADRQGIKLIVRWKSSCPPIQVRVVNTANVRDPACDTFQSSTVDLIHELRPNGVILGQATAYVGRILSTDGDGRPSHDEQLSLWGEAYGRFLESVAATGTSIAVIEDNPRMERDPLSCLSKFGNSEIDCIPTRNEGLEQIADLQKVAAPVIRDASVAEVFTTVDTICGTSDCKLTDGDNLIFRDNNHLSREWTMSQVPQLEKLLARVA